MKQDQDSMAFVNASRQQLKAPWFWSAFGEFMRSVFARIELALIGWKLIRRRDSKLVCFLLKWPFRNLRWLRIEACRVQYDCSTWVRIDLDFGVWARDRARNAK